MPNKIKSHGRTLAHTDTQPFSREEQRREEKTNKEKKATHYFTIAQG